MAITSNCAEIIITNPQGSISFNKLITTTELSPAKTIYSEDRVYLIQNSENVPQTFWWNLEKAIADGYADLEELYDYFVAEIANQCGGGGGSPAGSDNQIQINQSGSFFADNKFQKSDTGFNVGLDHTTQSAVTFTGSGLDDLTVGGVFTGTVPTTYTVTIDGVNVNFLVMDTGSITGGSFAVSDVVTNGTGGTATILSISVDGSNTYLGVNITAGSFSAFDVIDNGSGVTATIGTPEVNDTYTLTDGTTTLNDVPALTNPNSTLNGIKTAFGASIGHTLSNSWTWTYSTANQNVLDFSNNDYKFQSILGTDTFGYQISNNLLGHGTKGSGNTYSNVAGDQMLTGYADVTGLGFIGFNSLNVYSTGEIATMYANKNGVGYSMQDSFGENVIQTGSGVTTIGNTYGGNNTKITIDDVAQTINFNGEYSFPFADGTSGQTLVTDGAGTLSWASTQKMQIALTDRSNNIVASTIVHEFIVLENFEITSSPFISLVTAPTGANFILQIQKNGVEVGINTKALVVTAGTNVSTATTDFNGVTFAKGDRISFRVTQIGSVNAGKGLDILLNFKN